MAVFSEKLDSINNALVSYSSVFGGFSEVAPALNPGMELSEQAKSLLIQFDKSQGSKILEVHSFEGMALIVLDGKDQNINVTEPRFVEDDLKILIELGLLRHDYNSNGENLYIYTRAASSLVKAMNKES